MLRTKWELAGVFRIEKISVVLPGRLFTISHMKKGVSVYNLCVFSALRIKLGKKRNEKDACDLYSTSNKSHNLNNREIKNRVYRKRQTWDSRICFFEKVSTQVRIVQNNFGLSRRRKTTKFSWETENSEGKMKNKHCHMVISPVRRKRNSNLSSNIAQKKTENTIRYTTLHNYTCSFKCCVYFMSGTCHNRFFVASGVYITI